MIELPTPETDAAAVKNIYGVASEVDVDFARRLEHERDEARDQNAKLRKIAERAIVPLECDGVPYGAKLRAELDQLKEGAK